jgi:hypothetical protein
MLADDITDRIAIACPAEIDGIIKDAWTDHTNGRLTENEIEALDEAARARREAVGSSRRWAEPGLPTAGKPKQLPAAGKLFPNRRPPPLPAAGKRSPDRQASIERRRRLAASGPMPPALAAKFSTGMLAVLKVVGDAVRHQGRCDMCMDEIAGRAGVCRRLAQTGIREAEALGLLAIRERRLSATRNDTNVITIISAEWLTWLRIGPKGGGCKSIPTTPHSDSFQRPRMVSGYRQKRLGERRTGHRPPEKGVAGAATSK